MNYKKSHLIYIKWDFLSVSKKTKINILWTLIKIKNPFSLLEAKRIFIDGVFLTQ